PQSTPPPNEDFESYYLKQITAEFADDIDKLRNAPDFSAQSVPILVQALKQGSKGFTDEEKDKVMRGR
ncbi:ribosome-assembly protein 3-domain-containing protein, partial [Usnea florida]